MGINITTTEKTEVRIPVFGTVTAGDLLVNAEGIATKPSTLLSMAQLNNTAPGLSVIYPVTSVGNYGSADFSFYKRFVENPNGEILTVMTGNGTTNTTGVRLTTTNLLGTNVSPAVMVSSAATCATPRIKRLTSTTVLIAWTETSVLRFAIYNNDGTVAVAASTVTTLASGSTPYWNMSVLVGSDIVFAYSKVTSNNCTFTRYNALGVLQGTETIVEASAILLGICIQAQTSGGFVVYYFRQAATTAYNFARYNATGVLQGALTTVAASSANLLGGEFDSMALELSNGNLVFQWQAAAQTHNYSVYNSAGSFISTVPSVGITGGNHVLGLAVTANGGFATATSNGSSFVFRTFTASGAGVVYTTFSMPPPVFQSGQSGVTIIPLPQGFAVFSVVYENSAGSINVNLATISTAGVLLGSVVAVQAVVGGSVGLSSLMRHSSGALVVGYFTSGNWLTYAIYNPSRASVLGVALESASEGSVCRVGTKGTYTINQSLSSGGVFDQRTAAIQGTKGSVIGSTAVLYGLA